MESPRMPLRGRGNVVGERREQLQQTGTTGVFGRVGDPAALVPVERDPVTGKSLDPRRARRDKRRQQSNRPSAPRPKVLVAAAIGAVVLVGAGIAVAATSGGSGGKHKTAVPPTVTNGGTLPGGAVGGSVPTGVQFVSPEYAAYTTISSHVLDSGGGYQDDGLKTRPIRLQCDAKGCALALAPFTTFFGNAMGASLPADAWSFHQTLHAPNGLFYQCIPSVPGDWTLDLRGVGTTTQQGFEIPARIVGTVGRKSPQTSNCPGIDAEYRIDSGPSNPFGGSGSDAVSVG
jgi:hypothetical protein